MNLLVSIHNENPYPLRLSDIKYRVGMDGTLLAWGKTSEIHTFEPDSESQVNIGATVDTSSAQESARTYIRRGLRATLHIQISAALRLPPEIAEQLEQGRGTVPITEWVVTATGVGIGTPKLLTRVIDVNPRYMLRQIIELAGPSVEEFLEGHKDAVPSTDDPEVLVRTFVQNFVHDRDLIGDARYYTTNQDGIPQLTVTSRDIITEFEELSKYIGIRFQLFDHEGVQHLREVAGQIKQKPYVMGAFYNDKTGRISVYLVKPNWDRWQDIYQEYPDLPFRFYFSEPPEALAESGAPQSSIGGIIAAVAVGLALFFLRRKRAA